MTWLWRYRIRHYSGNSLWLLPVLGVLAAMAVVRLLHWIDQAAGWKSDLDVDTVRSVLGTMASAMFTFIVFVSSALLVAVQLASAQLSPRIIGIVFKDPVTKLALTLFVFMFTLTLAVLVRINSSVPAVSAQLAAYSCLVGLGVFLYLLDHVGKMLRPSGALKTVGYYGRLVIANVYPRRLSEVRETPSTPTDALDEPPTFVVAGTKPGAVLAFDLEGIASLAERAGCTVVMVPQVGDFVAVGDPLFRVYEGGTPELNQKLLQSVAVGMERTLEQDPMFAFRIIVDIACKGLSAAINDPTTAVLALDQLHHLLRSVGSRELSDGQVRDARGRLRLLYRTPDWDDFVHLAVTEIRHYGGTSIQIARRLRAMLENLIQTLPVERGALLHQELSLLHRSIERFFPETEDRVLADVGDPQGVGGKKGKSSNAEAPHPAGRQE
jgi:uncharacterized membrane protein